MRVRGRQRPVAVVAGAVGGQPVARVGLGGDSRLAPAGNEARAEAHRAQRLRQRPCAARPCDEPDPQHRGERDEAVDRQLARPRRVEADGRAHRVRHREPGARHVGHDLREHGLQVAPVVAEAAHMALARVAQQPVRAALAAPVHRDDAEAAPPQVLHCLVETLDELGAPAQQQHRAARGPPPRGPPGRDAQRDAVAGLHDPAFAAGGRAVALDAEQFRRRHSSPRTPAMMLGAGVLKSPKRPTRSMAAARFRRRRRRI